MFKELAQNLTDSIDDITRRWVEELRQNTRTVVHQQLLSAEIVDGVKGMLQNLARAIRAQETPTGELLPSSLSTGPVESPEITGPMLRATTTTRPLRGPLEEAQMTAASLGSLRHGQGYEINEVVYEYARLRQEIWNSLRWTSLSQQNMLPDLLAYVDRLLDELMLTTVESFYNSSVRDLEKRAVHDIPTQLYNKEYFRQRLNEELRRAIRYGEPLSVVMLDMDKLKEINDSYGHAAGDEALKAIASAIRSTCRQSDVPCRYGGDEFAVILPETSKSQAKAFAERVIQAVQSLSVVLVPADQAPETHDITMMDATTLVANQLESKAALFAPAPTVSIGLASFPEDARNPETLLARADAALYRAKNEGRNRISD